MGKLKGLEVIIDKQPVFAGHTLTGRVAFNISKSPITFKSVTVNLVGLSKVGWTGDGTRGHGKEHCHIDLEIPLAAYLTKYVNSVGKYRLPVGDHALPFAFPVPPYSPSSFGGKHGYVYYGCKAILALSGAGDVYKESVAQIIGIEDLNWHPHAAMPMSYHEGYNQKLLCFDMANVSAVVQLPRSGYVPGEVLKVCAEITNRSTRQKVRKASIQLVQQVLFKIGNKTKESSEVVAQLVYSEIAPGVMKKLEDEKLCIPALPPSFLRGCEDMSIKYELVFNTEPGLRFAAPILIGTVPFHPDVIKGYVQALPWKTESKTQKQNGHSNEKFPSHQSFVPNLAPRRVPMQQPISTPAGVWPTSYPPTWRNQVPNPFGNFNCFHQGFGNWRTTVIGHAKKSGNDSEAHVLKIEEIE